VILAIVILILLMAAEVGDSFIVHDLEPIVVVEMGDVYLREGK